MATALTGVRPLLGATLRQRGRALLPWVLLISLLSASSVLAYALIFPDMTDRNRLDLAIGANPALELIFGPARNLMTADGFNAWRAGQLGALFAALMAILVVVNNSRADEDSGQAELFASGVLSRQARLLVPILVAVIGAGALGIVCFVLTVVSGGGMVPTAILAAGFMGTALVFAGVAAVAAQLGSDARTANSLAIGTMGAMYAARGYFGASAAPDWTRWLTPFGWLELMAPASDNNPWPLLLFIGAAVALGGVALVLQQYRDFGLGMLPPRSGPAAGPGMNIHRLIWRVHRGSLLLWIGAFAFLGLMFGNLATTIGGVFASNPAMSAILAAGATTSEQLIFVFVATILQLIGIIAAVMAAQTVMRVYAEETEVRVEPLLAGAVRRVTYLAGNAGAALVAVVAALVVAGLVMGLVASRGSQDLAFRDVLMQAIVTIPAVWVLTGVSVATIGARPRLRAAGWMVIVATFGITLLGPTFRLPDWALSISPMYHVPVVTVPTESWAPLLALCLITLALIAVGLVGFRRRDIG